MYQIIRTDKLFNVSCLIFEQSSLEIVIFEILTVTLGLPWMLKYILL